MGGLTFHLYEKALKEKNEEEIKGCRAIAEQNLRQSGVMLIILAGVFVLTSLIGFCPLYTLIGLNTCPAKK